MRRLEFRSDTSAKFWQADVKGSSLKLAWGKIGTLGQAKEKEFESPEAAEVECASLVAKKLREGYQEVGAGAKAEPTLGSTPSVSRASGAAAFTQVQLDAFGLSVDALSLPPEAAEQFWKADLAIVGDLVKFSAAKLLSKGITQAAIDAIEIALAARGVSLGMKSPKWKPKPLPPVPTRDVVGEITAALSTLPASVTWKGEPPADEKVIAAAQKSLGIKFPNDYRQFLLRWNGITVVTPEDETTFYGTAGLHQGQADLRENWERWPSNQSELSSAAFLSHASWDTDCNSGTAIINDGTLVRYERGRVENDGSNRRFLDFILQEISGVGI